MADEGANRRSLYRIIYPHNYRPRFVIDDSFSEVLDIAEESIRYQKLRSTIIEVGKDIEGSLILKSGKRLRILGKVARVTPTGQIVVKLKKPIDRKSTRLNSSH